MHADPPSEAQRVNWLPAPKNADFVLFMRTYWPKTPIIDGFVGAAAGREGELN